MEIRKINLEENHGSTIDIKAGCVLGLDNEVVNLYTVDIDDAELLMITAGLVNLLREQGLGEDLENCMKLLTYETEYIEN